MKKKNKSLSLTTQSNGVLTYDCNFHTDRFTFTTSSQDLKIKSEDFSEDGNSLRAKFTEYMKRLSGVNENEISYNDLVEYYLKNGIGDIPHCVHQYVWQNYTYSLIWDNKKSQEAYLDGVEYLNKLADEGKIPRKNIPFGSIKKKES